MFNYMKVILREIFIFCFLLLVFMHTNVFAEPLVPYRMWQFHKLDTDYVSKVTKLAADYNINTVVYSHGMIWGVSQLYEKNQRAENLKKLASEAQNLGLDVYIWIHELEAVSDKFLDDGIVQMDKEGFWEWLENKYEKLFTDFPEFDGLLLTFHETQYKIFNDKQVSSALSKPERFSTMINVMDKVCSKYKKKLIVRTFLYQPQEYRWIEEGLRNTSNNVIIQSKCVPCDWQSFLPHNPMIGKFPDRKQIIEFDCSMEYTGKNRIPYTNPSYFEYRWRHALNFSEVIGYNIRLDHGGWDAMFTPNEINIYAMYRMTEDEKITGEMIWDEWTKERYGKEAAEFIENALKPTFDCVNNLFYIKGCMYTHMSKLPMYKPALRRMYFLSPAKWERKNQKYQKDMESLQNPDTILLEELLAEKDNAITLADESLMYLSKAKPYITEKQYDDFHWRLRLLSRTAKIWKMHCEALFGLRVLEEGHSVIGLKERIERAIVFIYRQADISEKDPQIGNTIPASSNNMRKVADELKSRFENLKK